MKQEGIYPAEALKEIESRYKFASDDIYYYNAHRSGELVRRLQRRTEEFDPKVLPELFEKSLGERIASYEISKYFGTGHIIVFVKTLSGKELVLRATHALPSPELYMDMEREVIARYKEVGIPSTEIIYSDASRKEFSFDYQIMLPLTGKDLEIEWEGTKEEYDALSFQLGRILAKQYQLPGEGWGRWKRNAEGKVVGAKSSHYEYLTAYLDHDLEVWQLFGFAESKNIEKLKEFFSSSNLSDLFNSKQSYFVHHDVADHNVRYGGGEILALYDWENAVVYDPTSDLGSAPTWKTHFPREQKLTEGFVAELGKKPDNLEEKVAVYLLRTMIWKVQFALKGRRLNSRHIDLTQDALNRIGLKMKLNSDLVAG